MIASHRCLLSFPRRFHVLTACLASSSKRTKANKGKKYSPPDKVEELFSLVKGNKNTRFNSPTAGAREQGELPTGLTHFYLYSLSTPNGQKVGIMLEELEMEYDAFRIDLDKGEQFKTRFVEINPNSKIPIAIDIVKGKPIHLFESGSILLYLAEKHGKFLPKDHQGRTEALNWLFWASANLSPIAGDCFGHFFCYAADDKHDARDYGLARYGMEVKRLLSVIDKHLEYKQYVAGDEYTIADIAIFPWIFHLRQGYRFEVDKNAANNFLSMEDTYPSLMAWNDRLLRRPAIMRGLRVCEWSKPYSKPWSASNT